MCHWPLDAPLRVSLPPDANAHERELLEKALRAWEAVVNGLRFEVVEGAAPIRLRFRDSGPEGARTAVDCEVAPPFAGDGPLDARLVSAQIELRRAERDPWGKPIELAASQMLGSAAHELGHALGLQGHAQGGKTVMVRETSAIAKIGEKLNDEKKPKPLQEPAMQALYSLPSGTVIERRRPAAGRHEGGRRDRAARARAGRDARPGARGRPRRRGALGSGSGPRVLLEGSGRSARRRSRVRGRAGAAVGRSRRRASGSESRAALFSRFAAGATSPSALSTSESRCATSTLRGSSASARSRCSRARIGSEGAALNSAQPSEPW